MALPKNSEIAKFGVNRLHHYFHLIDRVLIETQEKKQKNCVNWVWWFQQHFFPAFFLQWWCSESPLKSAIFVKKWGQNSKLKLEISLWGCWFSKYGIFFVTLFIQVQHTVLPYFCYLFVGVVNPWSKSYVYVAFYGFAFFLFVVVHICCV